MSQAEKPLLLIALMHDYAARDFADSGVLDELAKDFRLAFISTDRLTLDLSRYGPIVARHTIGRLRLVAYQLAAGLWHMAVKRRFELNRRNVLRQATFGVSQKVERAIAWLSAIGLARPVGALLRVLLRFTTPRLIDEGLAASAVLVYTSIRSFFADDIVRDAKRMSIPLLALANNWDNLNTKSFLEIPPYLGVWGEQGFLIARLMYRIPAHRIFVIGAPRFEIYRCASSSRAEARVRLKFPEGRRIVLFCGAGVAFDEISLLEELDDAIYKGQLPEELLVVYKPHPLRFPRATEKPFHAEHYRNVVLAPGTSRKLTELSLYPDLFAASDALISPFSTMVIEGARYGLPALCLGYNDPGHANHDWGRAAFNLHTYVIRHGDWATVCESRATFMACCERLVAMLGDPSVATSARAAAEMVWRTGGSSVSERIANAVHAIGAGHDADNSMVATRNVSVRLADTVQDITLLSKD